MTRTPVPTIDLDALLDQHGHFMTYTEAERVTSIPRRTLKRMTAAGDLPCYAPRHTKSYRLRTTDVASLLERVA